MQIAGTENLLSAVEERQRVYLMRRSDPRAPSQRGFNGLNSVLTSVGRLSEACASSWLQPSTAFVHYAAEPSLSRK